MNLQEIAGRWILLMGHVEETCEKHGLVPPVEVNVVQANGNQYNFDYSPEDDGVALQPEPIMPPVVMTMTDALGVRVERRLLDIAPSPEWNKRFVQ
jgi:hypothetical protein